MRAPSASACFRVTVTDMYGNAYYRARYPSLRMFPAHRLLLQMERAARSP